MKKLLLIFMLFTGYLFSQDMNVNIRDRGSCTTDTLSGGAIASISLRGTADSIQVHDVGHSLSVGDIITITGTGDAAYDITHTVLEASTDSFVVAATFTATGTGTYGEKFVGTARDIQGHGNWASIGISYYSDKLVASTNTLKILYGQNGTTWIDSVTYTISDSAGWHQFVNLKHQWYKIEVQNLVMSQSTFMMEVLLYDQDMTISQALEDSTITVDGTVTATPSGVQEIEGDEAEGASLPNPVLIGGDDGTDIKNINVDPTTGDVQVDLTSSTNFYSRWLITDSAIDTIVFGFRTRIITVICDEPISDTLFIAGDNNGVFADSLSMITRLGTEGFTKRWAIDTLFVKVGVNITEFQHVRIEAN